MASTHAGSASELLVKVVHRMWDAMSKPDVVCMSRLVQAELTQFPEVRKFFFEHVIERHRRLLHGIATRGVATGEFRRESLVIIPRMVPSLVMQLNQTHFLFGDLERHAPSRIALRDAILTLLLDGIRVPGTKGKRKQPERARGRTGVKASQPGTPKGGKGER
jgi:hypothetical protein